MDWSSIYDESGDEDGDWTGFSSRLTPILENFSSRGKYTSTICYIFTINYILGVGCLGIPYAFLKSGIVMGSLLIIVLSTVAYMTTLWVAESGFRDLQIRRLEDEMTPTKREQQGQGQGHRGRQRGRAWSINISNNTKNNITATTHDNTITNATPTTTPESKQQSTGYGTITNSGGNSHGPSKKEATEEKVEFSSLSTLIERESLLLSRHTPSPTGRMCSPHTHKQLHGSGGGGRLRLSSEDQGWGGGGYADHTSGYEGGLEGEAEGEAEVVELVLRFLGPSAKSSYQVAVMCLMSIGLIAYCQVFVQTFRQQLWASVPEFIPVLLFAGVVVPLSCIDLAEQISIQVVMAVLRFVSLATLVFGTLVAIVIDTRDSGWEEQEGGLEEEEEEEGEGRVPLFAVSGFSLMFTTAIFSQLFQHSVPGLVRPLSPPDKQQVPSIFLAALCTTGFFYLVIGMSSVYYFGPSVNQAINLNFVNFSWGMQHTRDGGVVSLVEMVCVRSLSMVVVLFPAMDTISVYPLIANTLGNNLNVSFPHTHKSLHTMLQSLLAWLPLACVPEGLSEGGVSRANSRSLTTLGWRLMAAVPPIVWSVFITDLSLTLQFAGLCGILVALVTPALLQLRSVAELQGCGRSCSRSASTRVHVAELQECDDRDPDLKDCSSRNEKQGEEEEEESGAAANPYVGVFSLVRFTYAVLVLAGLALMACSLQIYGSIMPAAVS